MVIGGLVIIPTKEYDRLLEMYQRSADTWQEKFLEVSGACLALQQKLGRLQAEIDALMDEQAALNSEKAKLEKRCRKSDSDNRGLKLMVNSLEARLASEVSTDECEEC